ncbi:MAG: BamA/TamA family outer membrane protein [Bacteroidales bacterium]|nr:BamA/TamA family outer membrane protein [Bacteroidales bacterium]
MNVKPFLLWLLCFTLAACSTTKYVPEGQFLLDKVNLEIDDKSVNKKDVRNSIRQLPNMEFLGIAKTTLMIYSLSNRDSSRWFSKLLRKLGDPPVILDTTLVERSNHDLRLTLINKGYTDATVSSEVKTKKKKAVVTYTVEAGLPFRIREYGRIIPDTAIAKIVEREMQRPPRNIFKSRSNTYKGTLIKPGDLFDRNILDEERQRIASGLRRSGYYGFGKNNLGYLADTTVAFKEADITLYTQLANDSVPTEQYKKYRIGQVFVYTGFDPLTNPESNPASIRDTIQFRNINIVRGKGDRLRSSILWRNNYIEPGSLYNERRVEQTYSAYAGLRALKSSNIRFSEYMENDSAMLKCSILTIPGKKMGFGIDLEGTNTAGDLGVASIFTYQHRNLFKGSEVLALKVRGAYEAITSNDINNFFEIGGEASINIPTVVFPFLSANTRKRLKASTEFAISYDYQTRPEYDRTLTSGSWKYIWQNRFATADRHTFRLLDIDYVYLPRLESSFRDSLPANTVLFNYTNQFIVSTGYSFFSTNENPYNKARNKYALRASIELAGNILNGLTRLLSTPTDDEGAYTLFGIPYAQYAKGDIDFSRTITLSPRSSLAFHTGLGIAVPYSNSSVIPFERRYYAGGSNGLRGWSVRSLGPGGYQPTDSTTFYEQTGDIKLELSIEYRQKIFNRVELAGYIDAGNIWTIRDYPAQPDGVFRFDKFYKQIALSYGIGLRLDFDFFLVRFDTGFKAYDPSRRGPDRWAIRRFNFTDNFAWHFAVGYPF